MNDGSNTVKTITRGDDRRYVAFSLGTQHYAIPLLRAKEFIGVSEPTPLPRTPGYFKGIINLRGHLISVIDLKEKLRIPTPKDGAPDRREAAVIILDSDEFSLGMIVDSIHSVLALREDEISPPPSLGSPEAGQYLVGVARREGQLILILDVDSLLDLRDFEHMKRNLKPA